MLSLDISFCGDGAKCKKRMSCWRFIGIDFQDKDGAYWYSDFLERSKEKGKPCSEYIAYETKANKG